MTEVDQDYEAMARLSEEHDSAEIGLANAYELWEQLQAELVVDWSTG